MVKFKIPSMNCMSCVHNIKDAVEEVDPSATVTPDLKGKTVTIESSQSQEELKQVIEGAGYKVE